MRTLFRSGAQVAAASLVLLVSGCGGGAAAPMSATSTGGSGIVSSSAPSASSMAARTSSTGSNFSASSQGSSGSATSSSDASSTTSDDAQDAGTGAGSGSGQKYQVAAVVDGDTLKVRMGDKKQTVRLIGVDTPETKKPHVAVQCYGKEASSHMQSLVQNHSVQLVADPSQGSTDKYGRLLRYVYVGDTNVGYSQIEGGYAREYTYDKAYRYQGEFRAAQAAAQAAHRGTWGGSCNGFHTTDTAGATGASTGASAALTPTSSAPAPNTPAASSTPAPASTPSAATSAGSCQIKGNISSSGAKIAHLPGSATYAKTAITPATGERMFCSTAEALAAGWRIAED